MSLESFWVIIGVEAVFTSFALFPKGMVVCPLEGFVVIDSMCAVTSEPTDLRVLRSEPGSIVVSDSVLAAISDSILFAVLSDCVLSSVDPANVVIVSVVMV